MKIYNTLTRSTEEFIPLEEGKVKIYACGPTVYEKIHVGNARPIVVFDTLRRYFQYKGYDVTFAQNFTDIDDKIINRGNEEGVTAKEIAETYIKEYYIDTDGLGVRKPDIVPKATETMDEIIAMVEDIINQGYGYEVGGNVYFRARKFKEYGKLSRQPLEELNIGARIAANDEKEDPLDFALWKAAKPEEPSWESPWGQGRPGWHIECSAMVKKHLGKRIDIHGGGQDLIFPHHENEIAQSESTDTGGENYANYWMHNGYLNVDNQKMAKSVGNFFTVRDVAEKYGYEAIKFMLVSAHYRSPLNYSTDIIKQGVQSLERLHICRDNLDFALENTDNENTSGSEDFLKQLELREEQFVVAMDNDLNTADGVAALFELVRDINTYIHQSRPESDLLEGAALFDRITDILGILYSREKELVDRDIQKLIDERENARKNKDFSRADEIRKKLADKGIQLEDTPQGVKYHITN